MWRNIVVKEQNNLGVRTGLMLLGILLIGLCVAFFRIAGFGVDPFTCMNLGISSSIGWLFGTWQLAANTMILVVVFFTVRNCIGLGTIINMVFVGYIADGVCWLVQDVLKAEPGILLRIVSLTVAMLFASVGVALYMKADMGIAPYDSVAVMIEKATKKIPFHIGRVISDITVIVIGVMFCLLAGKSIWTVIGAGTVCNALFNGPLIQFFRSKIDQMLSQL